MKIIKIVILELLSFFYSKLIILSLIYNEIILKKKLFYSNSLGFGDNIMFYLNNYTQINKKNYLVFEFCKQIDGPINFFFSRSQIVYPLISIPHFIYYRCTKKIKKSKFFSPSIDEKNWNSLLNNINKDTFRKLIKVKLKNYKPSDKIENFFKKKKKFFCFFIKLSPNKEDLSGSNSRATENKNKIYKVINYLIKTNFHIIFLGLKNDPSVPFLKKYIRINNLDDYVDFLIDLSPTYNFTDQLFLAEHSEGYIGNGSGAAEIFFYLKKKALIFDHIFQELLNLPHFLSYRRTLFKKISINNSEYKLLDEQLIKSAIDYNVRNNYKIMENSYDDIVKDIQNFFFIK
jgi:hypothetical protein